MQELKDKNHLGGVEEGCLLIKPLGSPQIRENLATRAVVELARLSGISSKAGGAIHTTM